MTQVIEERTLSSDGRTYYYSERRFNSLEEIPEWLRKHGWKLKKIEKTDRYIKILGVSEFGYTEKLFYRVRKLKTDS